MRPGQDQGCCSGAGTAAPFEPFVRFVAHAGSDDKGAYVGTGSPSGAGSATGFTKVSTLGTTYGGDSGATGAGTYDGTSACAGGAGG
jgi:hypothetical protein